MNRQQRRRKEEAREKAPQDQAKMRRTIIYVGLSLAVIGALAYAVQKANEPAAGKLGEGCPDPHWHSTFAIYIPDADGTPQRVDFASPRSLRNPNQAYYQLGEDPKMGLSLHMHQSGAEQGSAILGAAQLHFESEGVCSTLQKAMDTVDVKVTATTLTLEGQHAQVGQSGTWEDGPNGRLRFWLQANDGAWHESNATSLLPRQPQDGEAMLIAYGNWNDEQIAMMQASVPPPQSRA